MIIIENIWSANQDEVNRLAGLPKKELMQIIRDLKLGTGKLSRKRLEKQAYDTIKTAGKPKKVYATSTSKGSKSDNPTGQEDT